MRVSFEEMMANYDNMSMPDAIKADLTGKVAVVMGGSAGVGLPIAHILADNGATTVIVSIDEEGMAKTVADIEAKGGKAVAKYANLMEYESVEKMMAEVHAELGRIDILVNSGGSTPVVQTNNFNAFVRPFIEIDPAQYPDLFTRFCFIKLYGIRAVLPYMKEQGYGKIINLTSDAGRTPTPMESMVGGGSAAVILMTKTIGKEASRYGVCINTIGITLVPDTEANAKVMASHANTAIFDKVRANAKLGLPGRKELAQLALFLASPSSDYLTGMTISLNGGASFPG